MTSKLISFLESQSYKSDFKDFMKKMEDKYGSAILEECGIGSQLDISKMSKDFFKTKATADVSVDANANVADTSVISHKIEMAKPFQLINSYYRIYKEIKKSRGVEYAEKILESQISGRIYINDFHAASSGMAYSYYGKTIVIVKYKGSTLYLNMENLFDMFSDKVKEFPDRHEIDLSNVNIQILDQNNKFVKLTHILRHKAHCGMVKIETKNGFTTIVTEDHPVILEDMSEKIAENVIKGDKLKISDTSFEFFDSKNTEIDRIKYIIGFSIGDGYLTGGHNKGYSYQMSIIQKNIKDHKIYKYVSENFDNVNFSKKPSGYGCDEITFGNKCFICKEGDIKKGAENKVLPKDILNWDKNEILSLIAGLIDADGTINGTSGVVDIRLASYTAIQQVAEILRWVGCERVRTSFVGKYQGEKSFHSSSPMFRVSFVPTDEVFISYSDKMSKYKDLILRDRGVDGRYETNEVLKVLPFEQEYVYDVTTETGHFHSQGLVQHNCFNYSTFDTALMGIPGKFDGRGGSKPPKNLMSFLGQIELFSLIAGNSTLGATGLADLLIVMSIYMKKILDTKKESHFILGLNDEILSERKLEFTNDENCWKYAEALLTGFIYRLNQPYRGSQSLFSNVSVFDKYFLEGLLPSYSLEIEGEVYSAEMEVVQKMQDVYINIMNRELARKPITFPVTTACFSIDEDKNILDKEFLKYISEKNLKFGFINMYSGKSSTLSSCCFDKDQLVLAKSSNLGVIFDTFENVYNMKPYDDYKKNFTIYHNGSWTRGNLIRIPRNNKKMFKVTTTNNKQIRVTEDHINVTLDGNKKTTELTTGDYLAFNTRKLDTFPEKDQKLTYEQGFIVGLYLGDGSKYKRKDSENYEITFSLNKSNEADLGTLQKGLDDWKIEKELHIYWQNNTMLTKLYSKELFDILDYYVEGDYSFEKELNMNILLQSVDFRRGIIEGWYASDGGNSLRIYTTSENLIPQAEALFNSLGLNTSVDVRDRIGENKVVIRGKEYDRNFPTYCIRWYDMKNKRSMGDVYKVVNNTEYFRIKEIEEIPYTDDYVYCFEMHNQEEPYFTLPNGIITHNCRLRSEQDNEYFNSFGSGSTKIGSLSVSTGNLPQLAFKLKNEENARELFLEKVKELVIDCQEANNAKRNLIKKAIKAGAQPLYSLGYMDIKRQYSTFGVVGLYEALQILGLDIKSQEGKDYALKMMDIVNETNKELQSRFKAPHNCEQIPAENVAVKLAKKDKILGYNNEYPLYSNQFIPLIERTNMLDRIELQGTFDSKFSGGAICHLNMDQEIKDAKVMSDLIEICAKKGVVYFAINYVLQECEDGHMSVGNVDICPICGKPITGKYTRVVGFLTKVNNWNKTRRESDFPNRQFYGSINV